MTALPDIAWPTPPAEPAHVQRWREEARERLAALGLPGPQDEHWRRASFKFLAALAQGQGGRAEAPSSDAPAVPAEAPAGLSQLLFVDGRFDAHGSTLPDDDAASIARLQAALRATQPASRPWLPNAALAGDQRLALVNHALGADGTRIVVHRGRSPVRPILLAHRGALAHEGVTALSHSLSLEAGASALLIELHDERCSAARTLLNELRIELGAGASLTHLRLVAPTHASHWVDTLTVELGRDARYVQRALFAPLRALRSTQHIRLLGTGAEAALHTGVVAARGADCDLRVVTQHEADHTRSDQTIHVLGGSGRATIDSEAEVPAGRRAVRSLQSLRALQLEGTCDIALRPRLAIRSDDVDCKHGATTSAFSDDQLFFLRSRGLARSEALRLLAAAHLQQLFPTLGEPVDALLQPLLQAALGSAIDTEAHDEAR